MLSSVFLEIGSKQITVFRELPEGGRVKTIQKVVSKLKGIEAIQISLSDSWIKGAVERVGYRSRRKKPNGISNETIMKD